MFNFLLVDIVISLSDVEDIEVNQNFYLQLAIKQCSYPVSLIIYIIKVDMILEKFTVRISKYMIKQYLKKIVVHDYFTKMLF